MPRERECLADGSCRDQHISSATPSNTYHTTTTMPPRLLQALRWSNSFRSDPISLLSFPLPLCQTQHRAASILSNLSDNAGAYNKKIRRGRGPSSGKGKTSGRGHKGQKQHGKVPRGFQGGQTPLEIVHGKRGFENQYRNLPCALPCVTMLNVI